MAIDLLRDNPELRPFALSNVRLTGTRIGAGAYGSVDEVAILGAVCAAKRIHEVFLDRSEIPEQEIRKSVTQFVKECQLMSTLRHPHVVQFLGVCFFVGSRLPALVMERLLTSLHDLLDPETEPPPPKDAPKPFFPLSLKCSILHNVACGLAYLHERTPPVIHCDLSARNVLLNSGMIAKIADLGVARIVPRMRAAATMTKAPGAGIYMPPEVLEAKSKNEEQKAKYSASIDVFSLQRLVWWQFSPSVKPSPTPACGGLSGDVTTVVCTVNGRTSTTVSPLKNDGGPTVERRYGHHLNGAQFQRVISTTIMSCLNALNSSISHSVSNCVMMTQSHIQCIFSLPPPLPPPPPPPPSLFIPQFTESVIHS